MSKKHGSIDAANTLRSVLTNYIAKIFLLATGFLMTPFLLHRLGPVKFGLWALVSSVAAYGSLFDFGMSGAVVKHVAQYRASVIQFRCKKRSQRPG